MKTLRAVLTKHKLNHALAVPLAISVGAAFLVESLESDAPGANIKTLPDALWWAAATVTTVGHGDHFPVTAAGRGVGVALMVVGIAVFGFLAASIASYLLDPPLEAEADAMTDVVRRLDRIELLLTEQHRKESDDLPATRTTDD